MCFVQVFFTSVSSYCCKVYVHSKVVCFVICHTNFYFLFSEVLSPVIITSPVLFKPITFAPFCLLTKLCGQIVYVKYNLEPQYSLKCLYYPSYRPNCSFSFVVWQKNPVFMHIVLCIDFFYINCQITNADEQSK